MEVILSLGGARRGVPPGQGHRAGCAARGGGGSGGRGGISWASHEAGAAREICFVSRRCWTWDLRMLSLREAQRRGNPPRGTSLAWRLPRRHAPRNDRLWYRVGEPRNMTAPLLTVRNLMVRYGDLVGVADVSLEVPDGGVVALLGSNGAGKTTTLNAIAGLVPPGQRNDRVCRHAHRRPACVRHRRARPRASSRGLAPVCAADRRAEPAARRHRAARITRASPRCSTASTRCSRALPNVGASAPARCRAASGRCSPPAAR